MHLGYFLCLLELNQLTEECLQNCKGVGVMMDLIRRVSGPASNTKTKKNNLFESVMSSFQTQIKIRKRYLCIIWK